MADPVQPTSKKPWLSKTILTNAVVALAALFFPPVKDYILEHPETCAVVFSVINMGLRLVTKDTISLED